MMTAADPAGGWGSLARAIEEAEWPTQPARSRDTKCIGASGRGPMTTRGSRRRSMFPAGTATTAARASAQEPTRKSRVGCSGE